MKPAIMICVGGAALLAARMAFSQIKVVPPESVKILPPPMFTNSVIINTNSAPDLEIKRPDEIPFAKPGVYQTKPFSGLVLVPGPMHDDICIIGQNLPEPPIRIIRPKITPIPTFPALPAPPHFPLLIDPNILNRFDTNKIVK